ncbi:MAG: L,D-transpeptidase family protein [Alphaproteobacteria bacterium]|nr:L,D-transpeptidase family protein [Alphaproteobacteria bacterium]
MRSVLKKAVFQAVLAAGLTSAAFGAHADGYAKNYVGDMQERKAVYEDTLVHLAREYNLGFVEIRAANQGLDPWIPGTGAKVVIPTRHLLPDVPREGVVINLPEMRLYAFVNGDKAPDTYPIGIGREGLSTPMGETTVVRKVVGPVWRPTPRMREEHPELPEAVYPGPDNPMGTNALYLGWPQYAIHGTNKPYGIGRRVSSGCIRMYPEAILKLYPKIPVGTPVNVINQPIIAAWIDDSLYLEAHPTVDQSMDLENTGDFKAEDLTKDEIAYIRRVAGDRVEDLNWPRIRRAVRERNGYPVRVAKRGVKVTDESEEASAVDVKAPVPPANRKVKGKAPAAQVEAKAKDAETSLSQNEVDAEKGAAQTSYKINQ